MNGEDDENNDVADDRDLYVNQVCSHPKAAENRKSG